MSHAHSQTGTSPAPESTLEPFPTAPSWLFTQGFRYPDSHVNPLNGYPHPPAPPSSPGASQYPYDRDFLPDTVFHDAYDNPANSGNGVNLHFVPPHHPLPPAAPPNDLAPPFSPDIPNDGPLPRDNRYEDLINRIEEQQEALRDARDDLIGSRFRLQSKRQELRATRMTAATEVGAAFSLVKRYLLQQGFSLPSDIEAALAVADNSRDTLGLQESEYEEAEERYNQEEWGYTEKETAFIEGLPGNTPVPIASPAPPKFDASATRLTHASVGSLDALNVPVQYMDWNAHPAAMPNAEHVKHISAEESIRTPAMFEPTTPPGPFLKLSSSNMTLARHTEPPTRPLSRPHSDTDLHSARLKWSDTRKQIEVWLLDTVQCSKLEQHRLRRLFSRSDLNDHDWWQLVVQTWTSESSDDNFFHTGDTTAPITTISDVPVAKPPNKHSPVSDTSKSNVMVVSEIPPLLEGRFIDHFANQGEVRNSPTAMELHDLDELLSQSLAFLERPQSVLSTAPTIMTPPLFGIDDGSATEEEVHSSCTSSENGETVCRDHASDGTPLTIEYQNDGLDTVTPSLDQSGNIIEHRVLHTTSNPPDQPRCDTSTEQRPIDESSLPSPVRPYSPESEHGRSNSILHRADSAENRSMDFRLTRPLSPPHTRSCTPGSDRRSLCPFAPFIRIDSPTPWYLPLLRLTPFSEPPACTGHHRLEYFPFVSLSRSPFRLPGPVKVQEVISDDQCH